MRARIALLGLAGVCAGAFAAEATLRTLPIIGVLGILFGVSLSRPQSSLAGLAVAATVAVGSMASFGYGAFALVVSLGALAVASSADDERAMPGRWSARAMPSLAVAAGLMIALSIGDIRLEPDERANGNIEWEVPEAGQRTAAVDAQRVQSLDVDFVPRSDTITYDDEYVSAVLSLTAEYDMEVGGTGGLPLVEPLAPGAAGDGPQPAQLPWLLALIAALIGVYTIVASWKARRLQLVDVPAVTPLRPATVLDWYDGIADQAGHPRHPADPVLGHSRRLAAATGDDRFGELGRLVSAQVYDARMLTKEDLDLIRRLGGQPDD